MILTLRSSSCPIWGRLCSNSRAVSCVPGSVALRSVSSCRSKSRGRSAHNSAAQDHYKQGESLQSEHYQAARIAFQAGCRSILSQNPVVSMNLAKASFEMANRQEPALPMFSLGPPVTLLGFQTLKWTHFDQGIWFTQQRLPKDLSPAKPTYNKRSPVPWACWEVGMRS